MSRKFDIGRQNEVLMNSTHYDIFKAMEYYFNHPSDFTKGPETFSTSDGIQNGALWLDKYNDNDNADLKYYDSGTWKLLFGDRFKLITHMLDSSEPTSPVEGQLWINSSGILTYYKDGQFIPIKSTLSDTEDSNTSMFEDFLAISPLEYAEHAVLNNFSKFLFANTPILPWTNGTLYYYQQGVTDPTGVLYVCNREHYASDSITLNNPYYWSRVDSLIQFLVPNTVTDKVFINGLFAHEKVGSVLDDIKETLYKSFGLTFGYEDDSVIHDSLRFDIDNDAGYYDTATLLVDGATDIPSDTVDIKPITEDEGYIANTNIALYIPESDLMRDKDDAGSYLDNDEYHYGKDEAYKMVSAIHVNPVRVDKITKHFIKLDKTSKIVPIIKENTEFYGIIDGIGTLLFETTSDTVYDYCSALYNNNVCIKISDKVAMKYDYIYAIHYDFISSAKKVGLLYRKKVQLNDETSIYIGKENDRFIAVFAQGLFYQQADDTYTYNYDTEYIEFKDKLLVSPDERMDISVLKFPNLFKGTITTDSYNAASYISGRGYRIDINAIPYNTAHCMCFISGIQVDPLNDFAFYPDDLTAVYFTNFTQAYVDAHNGEIDWVIAETDWFEDSTLTLEMYRGTTTAINVNSEVGIKITRDKNQVTPDILFLDYTESPILFVDGILVSQKDVNIFEDYLSVDGLVAGQNVVMLADINSNISIDDIIEKTELLINLQNQAPLEEDVTKRQIIESMTDPNTGVEVLTEFIYEDLRYLHTIYNFSALAGLNSDNVLFEDNISSVVVKTERNDTTVLYVKDGLICDTDAVTVTTLSEEGVHGEIKHLFNTVQDKWVMYSDYTSMWETITETEAAIIMSNANGYTSYNNNVTILKDLVDQKYCTYFAYVYSDTVEKQLLTGFVDPDGQMGINDGVSDFKLSPKHYYSPGRNELTVYLNGIRQNLVSPFEAGFNESTNRECNLIGTNSFVLAHENGSNLGKAINAYDGYYTYKTVKDGSTDYLYKKVELTDVELQAIKDLGSTITLVSSPNKNTIYYVIEPCETGESMACDRTVLTYKDALSSKGAYANNTYSNKSLNLNKGNIKVFINGLRQPYGAYADIDGNMIEAYTVIDSHTIQVQYPLIGGHGTNLGDEVTPLFPYNPSSVKDFYKVIDSITVESRTDLGLREATLTLKYGQTSFGVADGLPEDLFKSKDTIMIYINGYAYGNTYKNEYKTITLQDTKIENLIDNSGNNFITFEWR
jgi:hypothetical protein